MMYGQQEQRPDGPDAADRSETSGDPPSAREQRAGELESLAVELRKTHKRLAKTAPQGPQMAFWENGLEAVQGHLDEAVFLLEECQKLLDAEKKDKLSEALERFDDAIILAFQKTNAARSSLEMPDQDFSAGSRSRDFVAATGQLKELASFCEATAVQLRGTAALVRQASAAQAEGSGS
jgi:hypothetical protein